MSSTSASLVLSLIFVVALAPVVAAARKLIGWIPVALFNGLLVAVVTGAQAGLFLPAAQLPVLPASSGGVSATQCNEALIALERARVILDWRRPPRMIVEQRLWEQLPADVKSLVLDCVRRTWPEGANEPQLEFRG